jgi:hypothetical protein
LPFIDWTWLTRAIKDEGTTESCSIATLMNITSAFYKLLFSQRAFGQKNHAKYYISRVHWYKEAQLKLTLCYVSFKMGTEKQERHTVSITILFTSEGHEAIWGSLSTVVFLDIWF